MLNFQNFLKYQNIFFDRVFNFPIFSRFAPDMVLIIKRRLLILWLNTYVDSATFIPWLHSKQSKTSSRALACEWWRPTSQERSNDVGRNKTHIRLPPLPAPLDSSPPPFHLRSPPFLPASSYRPRLPRGGCSLDSPFLFGCCLVGILYDIHGVSDPDQHRGAEPTIHVFFIRFKIALLTFLI